MDDSFFKTLGADEVAEFEQAARDDYEAGSEINPVWHPVYRAECERINERVANPPSLGDMVMTQLIFKYCEEHYDDGYDAVVEAWDYKELLTFVVEHNIMSVEDFIKEYQPIINNVAEVRAEIF